MRVVNLPTLYSTFNLAQWSFGCFFRFYYAFKAINATVLVQKAYVIINAPEFISAYRKVKEKLVAEVA